MDTSDKLADAKRQPVKRKNDKKKKKEGHLVYEDTLGNIYWENDEIRVCYRKSKSK